MEVVFVLSLPLKNTENVSNIHEVCVLRPGKCLEPASSLDHGAVYRITNTMVPSISMFYVKKQTCIECLLHAGSLAGLWDYNDEGATVSSLKEFLV